MTNDKKICNLRDSLGCLNDGKCSQCWLDASKLDPYPLFRQPEPMTFSKDLKIRSANGDHDLISMTRNDAGEIIEIFIERW